MQTLMKRTRFGCLFSVTFPTAWLVGWLVFCLCKTSTLLCCLSKTKVKSLILKCFYASKLNTQGCRYCPDFYAERHPCYQLDLRAFIHIRFCPATHQTSSRLEQTRLIVCSTRELTHAALCHVQLYKRQNACQCGKWVTGAKCLLPHL